MSEAAASHLEFSDIEAAAARLSGYAVATPLIESAEIGRRIGARVLIKPEMLQRTGSFKFRGAFSRLSRLDQAERARGVVAFSSGNHGQAVAAAAALIGATATIVMPRDAPEIKIAKTRAHGAEIVFYDRARDDRSAIAGRLAEERGLVLVPPFDDFDVMAGQGTLGAEICREAAERGITIDVALVPCGGGGLIAGVATAFAALSPNTRVYAVEPAGFDDTARSLAAGQRLANERASGSICDALLGPMPGALTFPINRQRLAGGLTVTDDETRAAMAVAFSDLHLVAEPGGATALAAALAGKLDLAGKTVAIVCSGGNVDPALFASIVA